MNEEYLYRLLEIVYKDSDIRRLVVEGLDYKTVGELTTSALQEKLLAFEDGVIKITDEGILRIKEDEKKYKLINKAKWIEPELKSRVPKIGKNDIFLPKQDELSF